MDDEVTTIETTEPVATLSAEDRAALVATITAAHPGVVPELLAGETAGELLASVDAAKAAYERIAARVGKRVPVAAGGSSGAAGVRGTPQVDITKLSPLAKISVGLAQRGR
jgi:hypothetical protein